MYSSSDNQRREVEGQKQSRAEEELVSDEKETKEEAIEDGDSERKKEPEEECKDKEGDQQEEKVAGRRKMSMRMWREKPQVIRSLRI